MCEDEYEVCMSECFEDFSDDDADLTACLDFCVEELDFCDEGRR